MVIYPTTRQASPVRANIEALRSPSGQLGLIDHERHGSRSNIFCRVGPHESNVFYLVGLEESVVVAKIVPPSTRKSLLGSI